MQTATRKLMVQMRRSYLFSWFGLETTATK